MNLSIKLASSQAGKYRTIFMNYYTRFEVYVGLKITIVDWKDKSLTNKCTIMLILYKNDQNV